MAKSFRGFGVLAVDIELINKLAKVYSIKFNLRRFGYEFEDLQSVVAEVFYECKKKYNPNLNASFETYVSRCVNNKLIDICNYESLKPLNGANIYSESEDKKAKSTVDEWMQIRDALLMFDGIERLIIKELIDPSDKIIKTLKSIIAKNAIRAKMQKTNRGKKNRRRFNSEFILAIRLVYNIDVRHMGRLVTGIKRRLTNNVLETV